ncbi:predicted protein [Plenodomus lingam JN3]|uniref:Predicted protein n=1 Tax=Leptosphaeria maculans (strain JN3 / isolate v23.1.3 / race Av1-4-5-6-7-8) TaxID=985895 RepID=E5A1S2_LEPMJ|nr:predicted protein [Plenodomus lingam JN3]CBX97639.1 predicted protein [Plenodomus lingam JN3]
MPALRMDASMSILASARMPRPLPIEAAIPPSHSLPTSQKQTS